MISSLVGQGLLSPLDLAFARAHLSETAEGFAFLAISSSLWRHGHPHLTIQEMRITPSLPQVTEQDLFVSFAALPEVVLSKLFVIDGERIYLKSLYATRKELLDKLSILSQATPKIRAQVRSDSLLSSEQKKILYESLRKCFALICGGPGTGKTFLAVEMIYSLLQQHPQARIAVVSPTGKASSHMKHLLTSQGLLEHVLVQTIHKFLLEKHPSPFDLILVDEGSMVTFQLLLRIVNTLSGIREGDQIIASTLIVFGDTNQLPPIGIGAGNPLRELTVAFPKYTYTLTVSHRAKNPQILEMASAILKRTPIPFFPLPPIRTAFALLTQACVQSLQTKKEFCILTPMRQGLWGFEHLNERISAEIKRSHPYLPIPIIVTKRYDAWGLCNGDYGLLHPREQELRFSHRTPIPVQTFPHYSTSYAMSIHKSQGSEYDSVIVLIPKGSEIFDPAILYTAVTRAKHHVTIWGDAPTLQAIQQS